MGRFACIIVVLYLFLLLSIPASAQWDSRKTCTQGSACEFHGQVTAYKLVIGRPEGYVVSDLAGLSPVKNMTVIVDDAQNPTDCITGGGSTRTLCTYDGAAWASIGGGGGGEGGGIPWPGTSGIAIYNGASGWSTSRIWDSNTATASMNISGTATGLAAQYIDWNQTSGATSIKNKPTLGGAALLNVGTTAGTVAAGDDSRLSNTDAQTIKGKAVDTPNTAGQQFTYDGTKLATQVKAVIEARDVAGVDCTGMSPSGVALSALSISGKVLSTAGCPLIRIDGAHPWSVFGQSGFVITGMNKYGNYGGTPGTWVFGCNGGAGAIMQINRSGHGKITGIDFSPRGTPTYCGVSASTFTTGISIDNTGGGGVTGTDIEVGNNEFWAVSAFDGWMGIYVSSAANLEDLVIYHNIFQGENSTHSYCLKIDSSTSQQNAIHFNNFSNCMWGVYSAGPMQWIEYNNFNGTGNYGTFGASASIYLSGNNTHRIAHNGASEGTGNFFIRPPAVATTGVMFLFDGNAFAGNSGAVTPNSYMVETGYGGNYVFHNNNASNTYGNRPIIGSDGYIPALGSVSDDGSNVWGTTAYNVIPSQTSFTSPTVNTNKTVSIIAKPNTSPSAPILVQSPSHTERASHFTDRSTGTFRDITRAAVAQQVTDPVAWTITSLDETGAATSGLIATDLPFAGGLATAAQTIPKRGGSGSGPWVEIFGATGSTSWAYQVVCVTGAGFTKASSATSVSTGAAALNGTDYTRISFYVQPGCVRYDYYRTTAGGTPNTTGKIASLNVNTYADSLSGNNEQMFLKDTGLTGDGTAVPTDTADGSINIPTGASYKINGVAKVFPANQNSSSNLFLNSYNSTTGAFGTAQPSVSNLSDAANVVKNNQPNTFGVGTQPATPAIGYVAGWFDSTDLHFHDRNSNGIVATTVVSDNDTANQWVKGLNSSGLFRKAQPDFTNLSGSIAAAQLITPTASTLGGVKSKTCTGTDKLSAIGTDGVPVCSADQTGTAGTGITTLNTLTDTTQGFAKVDDTNVTLAISSVSPTHTFTLGWTGTLDKSRQNTATVYNDAGNTWSTGAQDMSSATSFKVPTGAGFAPTASGSVGYDSTANAYSVGVNGSNKTLATTDLITTHTGSLAAGYLVIGNGTADLKTDTGAFTDGAGALTAASFAGPLTGNVTGNVSGTAATITGALALANTPLTVRGDILIATTATPILGKLAKGTQYQTLQGGATDPGYDAVHLDQATAVTGILGSANGGTGNGFTKFSGPTTAERTFTLPDASATVLTSNAAVTVAQGGTGLGTLTLHALYAGNTTSAPTAITVPSADSFLYGTTAVDPSFKAFPTTGTAGCSGAGEALQWNNSSHSTACLTGIAPLASPTFTGTVAGITATMVGLGSVTNDAQTKAAIVPNTWTAHAIYAGNGTSAITAIGPDSSTTKALFSAGSSADPAFRAIATTDIPTADKTRSCEIVINGTDTANALKSGDDTDAANSCFNKEGYTKTITGVYCRSTASSNTTTVNPTYGATGTGTTILAGALTCGSSNAYSTMAAGCGGSTCTISNAALADTTGISVGMGGTLTGTSIHVLIVYTIP